MCVSECERDQVCVRVLCMCVRKSVCVRDSVIYRVCVYVMCMSVRDKECLCVDVYIQTTQGQPR